MSIISIKTKQEIELMRQGGRILTQILNAVEKAVRPGVSTEELNQLAEALMQKLGVSGSFKNFGANRQRRGYPAVLCVSINDEVVHGIPGKRVIQKGDLVSIDCGVYFQGYHTDSARTILVNNEDPAVQFFVKTTQKALAEAIKQVQTGIPLGNVSAAIQKTVEQRGYAVVKSLTGHGIGKTLHEPPEILNFGKKGQGIILREGMTLAIEPITVMGFNGETYDEQDGWTVKTMTGDLAAHFEHTVAVTAEGAEILA